MMKNAKKKNAQKYTKYIYLYTMWQCCGLMSSTYAAQVLLLGNKIIIIIQNYYIYFNNYKFKIIN